MFGYFEYRKTTYFDVFCLNFSTRIKLNPNHNSLRNVLVHEESLVMFNPMNASIAFTKKTVNSFAVQIMYQVIREQDF